MSFAERTLEGFDKFAIGSFAGLGREAGSGRPIPARVITGGEGEVAREHQGIEVNLLGCLGAREGDRRSLAAVGQGAARGVIGGEDVPAGDGRDRVASELRWSNTKLMGCLERAERHWDGRPAADRSSPDLTEEGWRVVPEIETGWGFI